MAACASVKDIRALRDLSNPGLNDEERKRIELVRYHVNASMVTADVSIRRGSGEIAYRLPLPLKLGRLSSTSDKTYDTLLARSPGECRM